MLLLGLLDVAVTPPLVIVTVCCAVAVIALWPVCCCGVCVCAVKVSHMIAYLKKYFHPTRPESGYSLAISYGKNGARLSHDHERQYVHCASEPFSLRSSLLCVAAASCACALHVCFGDVNVLEWCGAGIATCTRA